MEEWAREIALGEDSTRQFKADVRNAESLAAEMVAFANAEGGTLFIGVSDDGTTPGLAKEDVSRINQLIGNVAGNWVRSPITVRTENIILPNGRIVIRLSVPKGLDKPYFDKNGVIWLKTGSDKRRVNTKEELRRIFQISGQFFADELPTRAGIDQLDKLRFREFLENTLQIEYPDSEPALETLLKNMNLITDDGHFNLAGLLLFARNPQRFMPHLLIKAVRYPGDEIDDLPYLDFEECSGALGSIYEKAFAFVMRNLHKVPSGSGVNVPSVPEIPAQVIEELLVNALVHRDYMISAPIRVLIFDHRIEIISPGHLPNNLTVEKIQTGNAILRNPILASYIAKGLLPYHGLGTGIRRALKRWPDIVFLDDRQGMLFQVTIYRKTT